MIVEYYNKVRKYGIITCGNYFIQQFKKKYRQKKMKNRKLECKDNKKIDDYIPKTVFFFNINSKSEIKDFYINHKNIQEKIIKDANTILEHKFDLLGSGIKELGKKIKWNQDFKSGFIWENKFYKNIKIIDLENNADVKIPWELSRFQHLFTLGKAYWITDDLKYYEEAKEEIVDWIEANPIYNTVNWTCAMDVAIRAINLIFFYYLFENMIIKDKNFLKILNKCLYQQGEYIYYNLEKNLGLSNNHYLSNLVGLLFLGIYFKDLKERKTKKWLNFSMKELEKEMFIQNNIDGTNYETSTSYHRLVLELMFYSSLLLKKNNISFSSEYEERLKKMFEFLAKITKPNGEIPLIGDVDNGRLVILSNYYDWKINDVRNIISLGGEYFNSHFFKEVGANEIEDKLWIFGSEDLYKEKLFKKSVAFENGGYYILQNNRIYCIVRCGELSLRGQGGHSHNDQLSIELNVDGEDFFIDTGTGVYTADKNIRNLFRSTKMHNTVSIREVEQNSFKINEIFKMQEETFAKCLQFTDKSFKGIHYGYVSKVGYTHIREIILDKNTLNLMDLLGGNGTVNFNLDSRVSIVNKEQDNIILKKNNVLLKIYIDNKNSYKIQDSLISKKYGKIEKNKKIEIYFKNKSKIKIRVD